MPVVYPQTGPGFPRATNADPALDGLRQLGSLSATGSGSTGPLNRNRLTEADSWQSYPPSATPPAQEAMRQQLLNSLKMAYGPGKGFGQGPAPERKEKPAPLTAG
jgi:hypothetical protein